VATQLTNRQSKTLPTTITTTTTTTTATINTEPTTTITEMICAKDGELPFWVIKNQLLKMLSNANTTTPQTPPTIKIPTNQRSFYGTMSPFSEKKLREILGDQNDVNS